LRQSHIILSNAVVIWTSRVLLLVPQLILVPYLIATIGETGYGVYALVWSLLIGIDQLEQSLQQGVVKYSAGFLAEGRIDDVNRVVSSSFVFSLLLGVLSAVGIGAVALTWQADGPDMTSSMLVVAGLMLLIVPLTPYIAVIQSRQRYYVGAIAETVSKYLSLAMIFAWFTWVSPSVVALIIITTGMLFVSRFAQVPVAYRLVQGLRNRPALCNRGAFRLLLAFGGVTVVIALANTANDAGLRWLMGILESPAFVAHLAIVLMPGLLLSQIVNAMTVTIMPATSAYEATGNIHMLRELLVRSMRYTTIIVITAMLAAALLIENILVLWVGPEYSFLAPYAMAIFASVALLLTTSSAHHMLKGLGKLRTTASIAVVGRVVVPLALILPVYFLSDNPYIAVAVGLVMGNVVWAVLHAGFAMNAVQAGFRETFVRVYGQPLLATIAALAPALAFVAYGNVDGLSARMGVITLAITAFLAQMYFLYATPAERRQVRDLTGAGVRRIFGLILHNTKTESRQL
jgi:O-antigen/teichoic acid export membrane protein